MAKKKRKKIFLIVAALSLIGLFCCIYFFSPDSSIPIGPFSLSFLYVFSLFLFLFLYSVTAYIFRSFIHGILVGLFPIAYLVMRMNDLTNPIFLVLLAGIFVSLEILLIQFTKRQPS